MTRKPFYRSLPRKGFPLFWILLAYLVIGFFYPVAGFLAIICMIAPVAFATTLTDCSTPTASSVVAASMAARLRFRSLKPDNPVYRANSRLIAIIRINPDKSRFISKKKEGVS